MNYGELKTLVAETAHRNDLTAQIPGFIRQAESLIKDTTQAPEMQTGVVLAEVDRDGAGKHGYTVPGGYVLIESARSGFGDDAELLILTNVLDITGAELNRLFPTSEPLSYQAQGNGKNINFYPTPPLNDVIVMTILQMPPELVLDTDENALLTGQPDLYLYGALHYLAVFVQDMELGQAFNEMFMSKAQIANQSYKTTKDEGAVIMRGAIGPTSRFL